MNIEAIELIRLRPLRRVPRTAPPHLRAAARYYFQAGRNATMRDEAMKNARASNSAEGRSFFVRSARFHNGIAVSYLQMARVNS